MGFWLDLRPRDIFSYPLSQVKAVVFHEFWHSFIAAIYPQNATEFSRFEGSGYCHLLLARNEKHAFIGRRRLQFLAPPMCRFLRQQYAHRR